MVRASLLSVAGMLGALFVAAPLGLAQEPEPSYQELLEKLEDLERRQAETEAQLAEDDVEITNLEDSIVSLETRARSFVELRDKGAIDYYESPFRTSLEPNQGGFHLAETDFGSLNFSFYTYLRYLNQKSLDDTFTDSFGRTRELDLREDLQFQKAVLYFKGWFLNRRLRYLAYVWSSNTSQGQGAQVVVAGNMTYAYSESLVVGGGIGGLPSVRSVEGAWPRMLKVDSRTIADDYFRGSYTTGVWVNGRLDGNVDYKVMLGNNLSQLGVDATQLDSTLDTWSASLVWMPTTGEYGPGSGFGDFEHHDELATRVGARYTHSTEDRQSQPNTDDPENTQIRLSDGTIIFAPDAFAPDSQIDRARYQMVSFDAGMKYRGFSLEGEYYWRWLDNFRSRGDIPFNEFFDHGFQVQASHMLSPRRWQVYSTYSKIFGEFGDPWDLGVGVNFFPSRRQGYERELRLNVELLYLDNSPTGNNSVPYIVGGNGPVFSATLELYF